MKHLIFALITSVAGCCLVLYSRMRAKKANLVLSGLKIDGYTNQSVRIGKHVSWLLFVIGSGIILGLGILVSFGFSIAGSLLTFNVVFISLGVYLLCINKYLNANQRIASFVVIVILLVAVLLFNYSLYKFNRPVTLSLINNQLSINSFYGIKLEVTEIKSVSVVEDYPLINLKQYGFSVGEYKSGLFNIEGNQSAYIYTRKYSPQYLLIESNTLPDIYMNYIPKDPIQVKLGNLKNH